jgi:molybdate transport system substrate-binding protein
MTKKMARGFAAIIGLVLLSTRVGFAADEIRVMTSGAFAAAHLQLAPEFERATGHHIVTETTSMGTGATGIAARLGREA